MGYKWDICLGLIRACLRIIRKYKKTGNPNKEAYDKMKEWVKKRELEFPKRWLTLTKK